jgi:guanylate kinase
MRLSHHMVVVSAPSGAGKTTICNMLVERNENYKISVSATTRPPRPNEENGIDYFFVSDEEFQKKVEKDEFLEWETVHGYYYGTIKAQVDELLNQGYHVVFDIDVNGALKIKKKYPKAILIFLKPPSLDELKRRLAERKSDKPFEIEKRLKRLPEEYAKSKFFDYEVVNNELNETLAGIENIIKESEKVDQNVSD